MLHRPRMDCRYTRNDGKELIVGHASCKVTVLNKSGNTYKVSSKCYSERDDDTSKMTEVYTITSHTSFTVKNDIGEFSSRYCERNSLPWPWGETQGDASYVGRWAEIPGQQCRDSAYKFTTWGVETGMESSCRFDQIRGGPNRWHIAIGGWAWFGQLRRVYDAILRSGSGRGAPGRDRLYRPRGSKIEQSMPRRRRGDARGGGWAGPACLTGESQGSAAA